MEKTTIYVARHGQTFWNAKRLFQGQSDIELSPLGEEQARRLGTRLKDMVFDSVYASDLVRTQQTARYALNQNEQKINIESDLSEICFGIWEGESIDELIANEPEQMQTFYENPDKFELEGMEKLETFVQRVVTKFEEIVDRHKGGNILIVVHGGVINALKYNYIHKDLNKFWKSEPYVKPTSLAILSADDSGIVFEQLPDASHCAELEAEGIE